MFCAPSQQASQETLIYSAKVVCVPDLAKRKRSGPGLQPGLYRTAVNVHNPWDEPAHIEKWLTLSPPQGGNPKKSVKQTEEMAPGTAFDVDCIHMKKDFLVEESSGVFGRIGRVPSGKGFLVVRSDRPLDVVAVYTVAFQDISGKSTTSIDVEYVKPVVIKESVATGGPELVAHWPFDEGAGATATDASDNGHTGTLQGGATRTVGKIGGALSLDGVDGQVSIPDGMGLDGMEALTIEAWVFLHEFPISDRGVPIVGKWGPGGHADDSYQFGIQGEGVGDAFKRRLYLQVSDGRGLSEDQHISLRFSSEILRLREWIHVRSIWKKPGDIKLFINGVEKSGEFCACSGQQTTRVQDTDQAVLIGRNEVGHFLKARIDELKIFDATSSEFDAVPTCAVQVCTSDRQCERTSVPDGTTCSDNSSQTFSDTCQAGRCVGIVEDNCLADPNKTQPGLCGCGIADGDFDGDGIQDCIDNCPSAPNANQVDSDADGIGNACELGLAACIDDSDCTGGALCVAGECVQTCVPLLNVAQCAPGEACIEGLCQEDLCGSDNDCPPGHLCTAGVCEGECVNHAQCDPNLILS